MSTYKKLLQAIKTTLETEFNVGKDTALLSEVKIMAGGFNGLQDVLNFSNDAPCVGIGIRGFPISNRNYGDQLESVADFSLYLITTDYGKENNGDGVLEALELLERLKLIIKNGKWNLEEIWQTEDNSIVCNNYYSPEFYQNGIILWEVTWRQKILLGHNKWEKEPIEITQATAVVDIQDDSKLEEVVLSVDKSKVSNNE